MRDQLNAGAISETTLHKHKHIKVPQLKVLLSNQHKGSQEADIKSTTANGQGHEHGLY